MTQRKKKWRVSLTAGLGFSVKEKSGSNFGCEAKETLRQHLNHPNQHKHQEYRSENTPKASGERKEMGFRSQTESDRSKLSTSNDREVSGEKVANSSATAKQQEGSSKDQRKQKHTDSSNPETREKDIHHSQSDNKFTRADSFEKTPRQSPLKCSLTLWAVTSAIVIILLIGILYNKSVANEISRIRLQDFRERNTMESVWAKHPTTTWQTLSVEASLYDSVPKDPRLLRVEDIGATVVALPDYSNGMMLEVQVHEITYFREVRINPSTPSTIGWVSPTVKRLINGDDFNKMVDRRANAVQFFRYRTTLDRGAGTLEYREYYKPKTGQKK